MRIFEVGGCVRDRFMGIKPKDIDYVVVGSSTDEMKSLGYVQVGADFPVFLHSEYPDRQFALARKERKIAAGYHGFETIHDSNVSLLEDLFRRDLTMNAMAQEVLDFGLPTQRLDPTIIDPYNGLDHIRQRLLRHVSDAFAEDPVRVLRVARFAARYNFMIHEDTLALMKQLHKSGELFHLTPERVWLEISKSLEEPYFEVFFNTLIAIGCSKYSWFPQRYQLSDSNIFKFNYNAVRPVLKQCSLAVKLAVIGFTYQQLVALKAPNKDAVVAQWLESNFVHLMVYAGFRYDFSNDTLLSSLVSLLNICNMANDHNLEVACELFYLVSLHNDNSINLLALSSKLVWKRLQSVTTAELHNVHLLKGKEIGVAVTEKRKEVLREWLN
jgi:tRNA nucleotidyltransferase/poly(A) polymerase